MWHKGSSIGCIARKTGKDRSSVCHKIAKNERHKRFSACATQKEGSCPPTAGKSRKGGTQTLRSLIVRRALVPQAGRRHLRLEYGVSCVVELLDYSAGRPRPPPSSCQVCHHLRRKGKRICSKRPKTQGKVEISHSLKDRPKQADVGSHLGDWVDDTLIEVGPVCLFALANRASRLLVARRWHHDSADVLKAELGHLLGRPFETITPERGKQFARYG
ncbi:MAG: hypothetical protein DUD39_11000 [Coriobacteriaceae bacterium]|nr:MAG: hypothetical protein DUD39_11000 [Coriobacteriaceae bacterium]